MKQKQISLAEMILLILIVAFLLVAIVRFLTLSSNTESPNLRFDAPYHPLRPKITLRKVHLNQELHIPRIESSELSRLGKVKKSLTVQLPEHTFVLPQRIVIKQPLHSLNKSSVVKIQGKQRIRYYAPPNNNARLLKAIYIWQFADGGDIVFTSARTIYGEAIWDVQGDKNICGSEPSWPQTIDSFSKAISNCIGFAALFAGDNAAGAAAKGIKSADDCFSSIMNLGCFFGFGCPSPPPKPLTNADIIKDMQSVLKKENDVTTQSTFYEDWLNFQNGNGVFSWDQFLQYAVGDLATKTGNNLIEYGTGQYADPDMLLSNSNYDSLVSRDYLTKGVFGYSGCGTLSTAKFCEPIRTFETILQIYTSNDFANQFQDPATADLSSQWPFYIQVLQKYITTLQQMAQNNSQEYGDGTLVTPWQIALGDTGSTTNMINTLTSYLPLAYKMYNSYVQKYLNNIVIDSQSSNCTEEPVGDPPSYITTCYDNYCEWGNGPSYDCNPLNFPSPSFNNDNVFYTIINTNGVMSNSTFTKMDTGYTGTNIDPISGIVLPPDSFFSATSSWTSCGVFPGWNYNATTFTGVDLLFPATVGSYFCMTDSSLASASLAQARNDALPWLHEYNGKPFDLLDSMASMAGVTCSQSLDGNGSLTGIWTCTPTNQTYTEGTVTVQSGYLFGKTDGLPGPLMSERGTMLDLSIPTSITLNYNAVMPGGLPSYTNGFPFDSSNFSSSGWFSISSQSCCPSMTTAVYGGTKLSISESLGDIEYPVKSRQLYCAYQYEIGNFVSVQGLNVPVQDCSNDKYVVNAIPYILDQGAGYSDTITTGNVSLTNALEDLRILFAGFNVIGWEFNSFFQSGLPLLFNSSYTLGLGSSYIMNTSLTSISTALSTNSGGTCRAQLSDVYSTVPGNVKDISTIPVMLSYMFSFLSPLVETEYPSAVTVTDGNYQVIITNTSLHNIYNSYSDPLSPTAFTGICSYAVDSTNYSSCTTGTSFQLFDSNGFAGPTLTTNTTYFVKVFEFSQARVNESVHDTSQCGSLPYAICSECPVESVFADFSWSPWSNEQYPPPLINPNSVPAWNVIMTLSSV